MRIELLNCCHPDIPCTNRDYTDRLALHWGAVYGNADVCHALATRQQEQLDGLLAARARAGKPATANAMKSVLEAVVSALGG